MATNKYCCMLIFISTCFALPQNYGGNNRAPRPSTQTNCRTEFVPIFETQYREEITKDCRQLLTEKCETKSRPSCQTVKEQICVPAFRQQCDTKYENKCTTLYKQVPYSEERCLDVPRQVCEKEWVQDGYGDKVWQDTDRCQHIKATDCKPVELIRDEAYQDCKDVPYENCYQVEKQECKLVDQERCVSEPYQDCRQVPYQDCKDVHRKVPYQVQKQKAVQKCSSPGDNSDYSAKDVANAFQNPLAFPPRSDLDDVELVDIKTTNGTEDDAVDLDGEDRTTNSDAIVFQESK